MTTRLPTSSGTSPQPSHSRFLLISACVAIAIALVILAGFEIAKPIAPKVSAAQSGIPAVGTYARHHVVISLPVHTAAYVGAFAKGVPESYTPMVSFAAATSSKPNLALYYSGWYEKFRYGFGIQAGKHGSVPFIQIEPTRARFAGIVAGLYDRYLKLFATAVAAYGARTGHGVVIGFGHEMNGTWYRWSYKHVRPKLFVAAWRHIVNIFRQQGADDVTWLWTVNIIDKNQGILNPARWWPGSSYVTWVGIDGYYLRPSWTFSSLFGPTIKAIHTFTVDPILISETGAAPADHQAAKISNLFAGVRAYGLLGFVWFDSKGVQDWRLRSAAALTAFRHGAQRDGRVP